ncbi:YiiX/YebB-like N1pC/P60 family cysteine hydrolase [Aeromonas rivipollensis]|uniref:YiiX/YebB-like N1pC/P60 family cysteine hydrolase n=1 Tax=Aeromonas rivipollensis TaxID=948519 RepID=UPI00372D3488
MKRVNIYLLKKGDIVLTTSAQNKPSGIIRTVTKSDISHAMICVSHGSVIDSTGDGVQARNIQKMFYDDSCEIYILRSKDYLPEEAISKIVSYARASTGTRYSLREAVASVKPQLNKEGGKRQFCSRMVARAYAHGGVKLVDNPGYCTPEDIKKSNLLIQIEPSALSASREEITVIQQEGDTTEGMRKVTNILLGKLRELNDKVESVNDINHLVVKNPELDDVVSKALEESGYLDFWEIEISRFPWRYDSLLMVQFYHSLDEPKTLLDYCIETISQDKNGDFNHWKVNSKAYTDLADHYGYQVFRLFAELYFKLSFYHTQRVKTAEILLKVYGDRNS